MVVYRLLGQGAVNAFARSFGVSYALNQATEWQDIAKEALKAVFVMLILERLFISSPVGWIEGAAARGPCCGFGVSIHTPPYRPHRLPLRAGCDAAREAEPGRSHPQAPQIHAAQCVPPVAIVALCDD